MKKVFVAAVIAVFGLGLFSCGHGSCDAYRTSDYSKYKKEHNQKVEMIKTLSETQK